MKYIFLLSLKGNEKAPLSTSETGYLLSFLRKSKDDSPVHELPLLVSTREVPSKCESVF